jgi:uncharacterized membrane protein YedE/YeeE
MASPQEPSHDPKKQKPYNTYLKYSNLALQMLATLGIAGWLGYELDQYLALKFPAFMLLFGFGAFIGIMIQLYRSVNK